MNKLWRWKIISLLFISGNSYAQDLLPVEDKTFDPCIQTVLLYSDVSDYAYPVIHFNSGEHLLFSFDDLRPNNQNYQFTMQLCDAQWKQVSMVPNEYITGINFEQINTFTYSAVTYQKYVHYEASFPTENMNVKYAGNYLLKVYRNFNENDIVFTRRCFIVNNKVNISSRVHQATAIDSRYTKQEVDLDVDVSGANIPSPYTDAKLAILQNGRFDNAITGLLPKYINGNNYNYDYEEGNLFFGGNEFRAFDTRNIRSVGQNVSTKYIDTAIHVLLKYDDARGSQQHFSLPDYNGQFIIDSKTATSQNMIDYAYITFNLNTFASDNTKDVYVLGAFNNWKPSAEFKMTYNAAHKLYECTFRLKQGYYNYCYVLYDDTNHPDVSLTEGNHFETENDYYIFFYQKDYFHNYDELIGFQKVNSGTAERK